MIKGCLGLVVNIYYSGNQVRLWDCNCVDGQKWVMDGSKVKPKYTFDRGIDFCFDVINRINTNGRSILWGCNGTSPQNWRAGDNDFNANYTIRIHAIADGGISGPISGHILVSMQQNGNLINTFSAWGNSGIDGDKDHNNSKPNNIAEYDYFYVDHWSDWTVAGNPYIYGYKTRTVNITKTHADWVRFGNGYRIKYVGKYRDYNSLFYSYANASSDLWNLVIDGGVSSTKVPGTNIPLLIYNSI